MSQEQEQRSRVPKKSVEICQEGTVERTGTTARGKELWDVKHPDGSMHTVTFDLEYRFATCDCGFGSIHMDKNGICSHIDAVNLTKKLHFLGVEEISEIFENLDGDKV